MTLTHIDQANSARNELHETLALLSQKLDYPTRIDNALERGKRRISRQQRRNPLAFAAGVAGVALLAGAAVAGVALAVADRVSK